MAGERCTGEPLERLEFGPAVDVWPPHKLNGRHVKSPPPLGQPQEAAVVIEKLRCKGEAPAVGPVGGREWLCLTRRGKKRAVKQEQRRAEAQKAKPRDPSRHT